MRLLHGLRGDLSIFIYQRAGGTCYFYIHSHIHFQGGQLVMGVSVLITCVAWVATILITTRCALEVPIFFYSEHILNRVSPDWTLGKSMSCLTNPSKLFHSVHTYFALQFIGY